MKSEKKIQEDFPKNQNKIIDKHFLIKNPKDLLNILKYNSEEKNEKTIKIENWNKILNEFENMKFSSLCNEKIQKMLLDNLESYKNNQIKILKNPNNKENSFLYKDEIESYINNSFNNLKSMFYKNSTICNKSNKDTMLICSEVDSSLNNNPKFEEEYPTYQFYKSTLIPKTLSLNQETEKFYQFLKSLKYPVSKKYLGISIQEYYIKNIIYKENNKDINIKNFFSKLEVLIKEFTFDQDQKINLFIDNLFIKDQPENTIIYQERKEIDKENYFMIYTYEEVIDILESWLLNEPSTDSGTNDNYAGIQTVEKRFLDPTLINANIDKYNLANNELPNHYSNEKLFKFEFFENSKLNNHNNINNSLDEREILFLNPKSEEIYNFKIKNSTLIIEKDVDNNPLLETRKNLQFKLNLPKTDIFTIKENSDLIISIINDVLELNLNIPIRIHIHFSCRDGVEDIIINDIKFYFLEKNNNISFYIKRESLFSLEDHNNDKELYQCVNLKLKQENSQEKCFKNQISSFNIETNSIELHNISKNNTFNEFGNSDFLNFD